MLLVVAQRHHDPVALGQPAHHEETHPPGGLGGDVAARAEQLVQLTQRLVGNPSPESATSMVTPLADAVELSETVVSRGGEGQRVVDELGEQVDHVPQLLRH